MSPLLLGSVQGWCGSSARGAVHFGSTPRRPKLPAAARNLAPPAGRSPPPSAASQRRPGPWPPPPPLPEDGFMDEVEEGTGEQGSSGGPVRGLDAVAAGRTSSFKPYHFLPRGITLV